MTLAHDPSSGQPAGMDAESVLGELAENSTLEATPRQLLESSSWRELLPVGMSVYVPFLPNADFNDTLMACRQLQLAGMHPVPHISARAISDVAQLRDWLAALADTGTNRLLLIAGDKKQSGPFRDTLAVLESGLLTDYNFRHIGIAGHPEGHPFASGLELGQALRIKRDYARSTDTRMWVVSQFAFDASPLIQWLQAFDDTDLPVYLGIPGPTRLRTLMAYAAQCGVGASARVMRRKPGATRLLGSWTPDDLALALTAYRLANPDSVFKGFHLFPFGGLERTAEWLRNLRTEPGRLAGNSSGTDA